MAIKKKHLYNILFFGFIIFLFTPYGLHTKSKITQGLIFLKGKLISPSVISAEERNLIGDFDVSFKGISNANNLNLSSLKGKVLFINHWATWCGPCRAEMPSLDKLYRDYDDKVSFLFLTNDPKKAVDTYFKANEFEFPTYMVTSRLPEQLNTQTLPATFIVDKEGRVVLDEFGPADWNTKAIREILDTLIE